MSSGSEKRERGRPKKYTTLEEARAVNYKQSRDRRTSKKIQSWPFYKIDKELNDIADRHDIDIDVDLRRQVLELFTTMCHTTSNRVNVQSDNKTG